MTNTNNQKALLEQLKLFVAPLIAASQNEESLIDFFGVLGWDLRDPNQIPISELQPALAAITTIADEVIDLIDDPPTTLLELAEALGKASDLFNALDDVHDFVNNAGASNMPATLKAQMGNMAKDILDLLTFNYLYHQAPRLYLTLTTIGIIEDFRLNERKQAYIHPVDGWERLAHSYSRVNYSKISALFSDPVQYLKDEFLPASQALDTEEEAQEFSDRLFPRLQLLFEELGFNTSYGIGSQVADYIDPGVFSKLRRTFTISRQIGDGHVGASFLYLPTENDDYGLVVTPFGDWNFITPLEKWLLHSSISGSSGFAVNSSGVTFPPAFSGSRLGLAVSALRLYEDGAKVYQIGSTTGTRMEIGNVVFQVFANLDDNGADFGAKVGIDRVAIVVGGGEGDGFLNKILSEPIKAEFDVIAGWSKELGFFFQGSGSLTIAIPVHKEFFGIKLDMVYIVLGFEDGEITVEISADTGLEIGPFSASISRLGLQSVIRMEKGNLGPMDANLKFKPPTGIGFSIDTNIFKGGGYLSFDVQEERYVGALELSIKDKIALKVIGVLTTKLPGNDDGYSLLLLITAEFQPINLGFGFTLNGVGGLIALNRTMNLNYLRDGVKSNTLDNILFPTDPVANIQQIISDLEGAFPVQEGRYAFGPMAIIGWGTPTLITIEIGLMLEVPNPIRLAILGVLRAILPTENKQLLKLQVNFIGAIDFEAKFITFDASIFESKLLSFTLSGDMVFRLKYGGNNNFLFSIGGFHPAFTPPPLQLPAMKRLTINLLGGDNPRLTLTAYFAVTSNSVQFGSAVDFYYRITSKWSVVGYLGFDILIQFNPFYLNAAIAASIALMKNGDTVCGIYLGGSVSGPAPWHVKGKAELEICGIKLKANFDKTFGEPETTTLPNIDVLPELRKALENKANWQASTPAASNLVVTIRELNNDPGHVVVHPFGTLGVSQKVVPLGMTINKFGTQRPADYQSFGLEIANSLGTNFSSETVKDLFAPAEYLALSDSAKLSRKSFEEFNSGVSIKGNDAILSTYLMERDLAFELVVMDSRQQPERVGFVGEKPIAFNAFTKNGSAAKSALGTRKRPLSENAPASIRVVQERYAIALTEDLGHYNGLEAGSEAEARVLLEELLRENPALTDQIQVVPLYQVA